MARAWLLPVILIPLLVPAVWNASVAAYQHAQNPIAGALYDIEGRQMHLYCAGSGPNTVVVEVGASADSLGWRGIQQALSRITRVCTYDRNGHGWSEPASGPHDAETIARKLHELLNKASVARPLILLGHSAGGLYIREYARQFPNEITGIIMVDSSTPAQVNELPDWRKDWEQDKRDLARQIWKDRLRTLSGWNRLTGNCHSTPSKELRYLTAQYEAETCRPEYVGEEDNELPYFNDSFEQAGRLTSFGNVPLVVISRDTRTKQRSDNAIWSYEQEQLKSLSPKSWRVIAAGAGHGVHHDRPEVITSQFILLIAYLQGRTIPPFGTTLVQ